jgi:hypothetical protein
LGLARMVRCASVAAAEPSRKCLRCINLLYACMPANTPRM